jgi:hypothetical protein
MGTRSQRKRWRRLERWQVLLASAVAAIASVVVALISVAPSGSPGKADTGVPQVNLPPTVRTGSSTAIPSMHIAITGLLEQSHPPPPGRLYVWTGTVRGLLAGVSIYVIDKRPGGGWLVSPTAVISRKGVWTVRWVLPIPPASARWIAVAVTYPAAYTGTSIETDGPQYEGVIASATYHPRITPTSSLPGYSGVSPAAAARHSAGQQSADLLLAGGARAAVVP